MSNGRSAGDMIRGGSKGPRAHFTRATCPAHHHIDPRGCRSGNRPAPTECHASGPCQNHWGSALIAAAIMRLTSPETACRPSRKGSVANIQRSRPPAPQPDVPALVAPRRHGSRAETRSRLSLIGDRSRWLPVGTDPRRGQKGSSNDAPSPRSRPRLVRGTERCQAGENTAHQAEIIDAIARDQRRSSEAGDLIR
jgi:hypothetical protein